MNITRVNRIIRQIRKINMTRPKKASILMRNFMDGIAKETWGMSLTEAQKQSVCLKCKKKVLHHTLNDQERFEYDRLAWCPECQDDFFE